MKLDQYEVMRREDGSIHRLGQGATSSSYKALDLNLRAPVVLKVIRPELLEDETAKKRFLREARAAALLRHPNVAQIYRMGEEGGSCFYAREFIEGETLENRVNTEGPLEVVPALEIALGVAQALVAVKKANLVHRDIKPSNLMLTPEGEIKIIDFGLTKSNGNGQIEGVELITLRGFVGSPDYASPEQLNEQELDVTSDIYSLGVTLWFLLTGRRPFRGPQARVMSDHLHTPPPFDELSALPPAVVSLLAHMIEKDPANRPASPAQLVAEIETCLAAVQGETVNPSAGATALPLSAVVPPLPSTFALAKKISPAREPAPERSPRRFVLPEVLIGAAIALVIYLVLSRPAPLPEAAVGQFHAPLAAVVAPEEPAATQPVASQPAAGPGVARPAPLAESAPAGRNGSRPASATPGHGFAKPRKAPLAAENNVR